MSSKRFGRVARALRSRGARRAVIGLGLAALFVAVAIYLATPDDSYQDPYEAPPPEHTACGRFPVREQCFDLDGKGRYALLKAPTPTADTAIVDFGGPGLAVLSGEANLTSFAEQYPELSEHFNLLVLEEPWVTRAMPGGPTSQGGGCDVALSEFYRAVRGDVGALDARGAAIADACQLHGRGWGFNPRDYADLVQGILDRHALRLRGFIGHSWGSARLTYLYGTRLDFAALVRPFPVGAEADRLVGARSKAIADTLPGPIRAVDPTELDSRSLAVTYFDQLSAVVALGHVDGRYYTENAEPLLAGEDASEIGRLSDELWGRYDINSLSPAKLAQWEEVCSLVRGSASDAASYPSVEGDRIYSVTDVLAAEFAPCATSRPHDPPQMAAGDYESTARVPPDRPANCVVTSPYDTVTPQELIHAQYAFIPDEDMTWVESPQRSHSSFDGLSACLDRLLE